MFGVAASYLYWNADESKENSRRTTRLQFKEEKPESTGGKNYQLESEDYKIIFDLIQKNPPKTGGEETKKN